MLRITCKTNISDNVFIGSNTSLVAPIKINKNSTHESNYSPQDYDEFNKIIPKIDIDQKKIDNQNKKVRIIDYSKIKGNEKKLKNKMGIDKIKIVYFD